MQRRGDTGTLRSMAEWAGAAVGPAQSFPCVDEKTSKINWNWNKMK
jgi:hypothetical protein